jgi:small subunit ribosomal protein S16
MAVKIRMTRMGRRHRPFFRINAVESRTPRDGRILEKLGHYDPLEKDADKMYVLNKERIEYWLGQGAVASETCAEIFKKKLDLTCKHHEERLKRRAHARAIARKQDKPFTSAERIAAEKAAEEAAAKAEAEAKAAEEAAKKKAEEEAAAAKAAEEAKAAETAEAEKSE